MQTLKDGLQTKQKGNSCQSFKDEKNKQKKTAVHNYNTQNHHDSTFTIMSKWDISMQNVVVKYYFSVVVLGWFATSEPENLSVWWKLSVFDFKLTVNVL